MIGWDGWCSFKVETGRSKAEPLADAEMKVSGAFEVFEGERKSSLVGEVLDGGDSVGVGVGDGYGRGLVGCSSEVGGGITL